MLGVLFTGFVQFTCALLTEYSNLISYHLFFCWRIQNFFNFKRISITLSGTSVLQGFSIAPAAVSNQKSQISFVPHGEWKEKSERERNGKVGKFILTIAFIWIINCYNSFLSIRLESMLPLLLLHDPFIDFQFAYYSNIFLLFPSLSAFAALLWLLLPSSTSWWRCRSNRRANIRFYINSFYFSTAKVVIKMCNSRILLARFGEREQRKKFCDVSFA